MQKYKKAFIPIIISISSLMLTTLLHLNIFPAAQPLLQRLNAITYDLRVRATVNNTPSEFPPIFIIDIDEKSLEQEGQWPWNRSKLATLIEKLHEAGSAVITLDIALAEPETNPVDIIKNHLANNQPELTGSLDAVRNELDGDTVLSKTIQDKNVILGYLFHPHESFIKGTLKPTLIQNDIPLAQLSSLAMQGYTGNIPTLAQSSAQNGFITVSPDDDGVVRRAALILEQDQQLYTSLAVEAAKLYLGASEEPLKLHSELTGDVQTITYAEFAGQKIRTDAIGQILIPYLGGRNVFPYVSATDVLNNGHIPDLTDAIVIIGTSAQALSDLRTTPFQQSYPGVEAQATLIHALLNPDLIPFIPEWKDGATILLLITLSLFMIILFPFLNPSYLMLAGLGLLASVIGLNLWLWVSPRIALDLTLPILLIILTSATFALHRLTREHHERQRIHDMFGQYVPVDHIDRMLTDKSAINMDGERREMSVLFSDIRNFTAISEHLSTQQLKQFLNHYLTPITSIIFNHQGTIDKYIGDLVMAFWGAPLEDPLHAEHAVKAALAMRAKTAAMSAEFEKLGLTQTVSAGIGIHSGEMNVGDMGSDYRRAYTVLGDAVNLGSRLESLTKQYGITILVSADTMQQCPAICFREIDFVRVKGRQEPVRIYEPLKLISMVTSELEQRITEHREAMMAYYSGNWELAYQLFGHLHKRDNDPLHRVYLQRMEQASLQPPLNWDGVYTHTSK